MARALYFTLFCVFQVMSAVTHVLAAPHNFTSTETFISPNMGVKFSPNDDREHDKRSLNIHPFEAKYLSTTHYTLEVDKDGTVRASRALRPEWGVLRIFAACVALSNVGSPLPVAETKRNKNSGKVSIRGVKANKYVCMNSDGEVYASEECTDECEFKQDKIGDGSKFRYYSLKYRGFINDPGRTKKRWYLGLNRGEVLKGHKTKKRKYNVQLMLRPVDTDNTASKYDDEFPTTPPSVVPGETDRHGIVSVLTSPSPNIKNTRKPPRRPRPSRKPRKCQDDDPMNLFRFFDCKTRDRKTRRKDQLNPFSRQPHTRHSNKKSTRGTESRSQTINLFSIPNR